MKYSYYLSKRLILVHILVIQLFLLQNVSSLNLTNVYLNHKCLSNQGNYKPTSEYEKTLNSLIKYISTQNFQDGYIITSKGEAPNVVHIFFQCRGDSYRSKCHSCFATAIAGLRRRCPRNKGAIIWYDQCFLDIGTVESSPLKIDYNNMFFINNPNNMSGDIESFNKKTSDFLTRLMNKAIRPDGSKSISYAAGEERLRDKKLYAMVQCGRYTADCELCLESSIKEISKCCGGKQGARVILGRSCNVRYELYPFLRT